MKAVIFREYDIRGIVGSELIIDEVLSLGLALVQFFRKKIPNMKCILIGMDGRISSPAIKQKLVAAFISQGIEVIDAGIIPSPVHYFGMHTLSVDAGCMITASHNPGEYNGLKIMIGKKSVWGSDITLIKEIFYTLQNYDKSLIITTDITTTQTVDLISLYIDFLIKLFEPLIGWQAKVVFDCGNGAASVVMPLLIKKFKWTQASLLCDTLDGSFPNHEADPTTKKNVLDLMDTVIKTESIVGIGFDGDADRMGVVNNAGKLFSGDQLLALFTQYADSVSRSKGIVFNVTMSNILVELCQQWKIPAYMVPTGHAIIKENMQKNGALLGGEGSCHFFFADSYFGYDDGIYAALRLLLIMQKTNQTIDQLMAFIPPKFTSPEYRIPCPDDQKKILVQVIHDHFAKRDGIELITIDGVRVVFSYGWAVFRAANTQPALSVRFEADTQEHLASIKQECSMLLAQYLDQSIIKKYIQ